MFDYLKTKINYVKNQKPKSEQTQQFKLSKDMIENIIKIRQLYENSTDFLERQIDINGIKVSIIMCEGMINLELYSHMIVEPLKTISSNINTPKELIADIRKNIILAPEQKEFYTYDELFSFIMAGFVVVLIDGLDYGIACGLQGYNFRSVGEPTTESNVRGSKEGFVEPIRVNQTMIRRRIKSPTLKFDMMSVGTRSKTDISLIYLTDVVSKEFIRDIKLRLSDVDADVVLNSGYIQPYLEQKPLTIFSSTGITERPDTFCAKITEGRVGILVDGTPFAIIIPYLISEHFQSIDDYAVRPFYATFIRLLKYFAFCISILLPGVYVATATFHPELIPHALLYNITAAEQSTPFTILIEALIIHLIYEIMREAGLRLPRAIGHAVSIVGALVIGDAAVTAGLIGAPMVMVVALTALSSFLVPSLYEQVSVLKFLFIIVGGLLGIFGIIVLISMVLINICAVNSFGIPASAPISPFSFYAMRDVFLRASWKVLNKEHLKVQDLPGSNMKK